MFFFLGSKFKILYASVTDMLEDCAVPDSPNLNLPEAFNVCKVLHKYSICQMDKPPLIFNKGKIKIRKGKLNKNFPKKTKIAAIIMGTITIIDLTLLAIFFDEVRAKDLSAQTKKIASIANIKNLI